MKIERLSENQIRCTLGKADLKEKHLNISEIAIGSPNAMNFFRELLMKAARDFGFKSDGKPLVVEAASTSNMDTVVLTLTKVQDINDLEKAIPELHHPISFNRNKGNKPGRTSFDIHIHDGEFSEYDEFDDNYDDDSYEEDEYTDDEYTEADYRRDYPECDMPFPDESGLTSAPHNKDRIADLVPKFQSAFEKLFEAFPGLADDCSRLSSVSEKEGADTSEASDTEGDYDGIDNLHSLIVFDSLDDIIRGSKQISGYYKSYNCLYKNTSDNRYYLIMSNSNNTKKDFKRALWVLGEYGQIKRLTEGMAAGIREHLKLIKDEDAIAFLSRL